MAPERNQKDRWDKAAVIGTVAGGVLVPLALALASTSTGQS